MLRQLSIGFRILIINALMAVFIVGVSVAFVLNSEEITVFAMKEMQQVLYDDYKKELQELTHAMAGAVGSRLEGVQDIELRDTLIRELVDPVRYGKNDAEYFFVYTDTMVVTVPPKPSLQGKNLGETKDKNGVAFVTELSKAAGKGGGFVEYFWDKPDGVNALKLGYAEHVAGRKDVWIGTGVFIDDIDARVGKRNATIQEMRSSSIINVSITVAALFLLGVLPLTLFITRSITRPVTEATVAAEDIARGEYDVSIDISGKDQVTQLMRALKSMAATLSDNIKEITLQNKDAEQKAQAAQQATRQATEAGKAAESKTESMIRAAGLLEQVVERVSTAAEEISAQTDEIRQNTELQRERIGSTATAMEEMNATVLEVARNVSSAAEQARESREKALQGAEVVKQSVAAVDTTLNQSKMLTESMSQLDEQAKTIGNIMGVITDIADQTNLLALNAAIEAARAGEAGRGFAVVADEVRKLAEKTMGATREVGESIEAIQSAADANMQSMERAMTDMEKANELSGQSGEVLQEIVVGAETSADQIRDIATAAEEQSATSEEINNSIEEVNDIAMETAEGMNETAKAIVELSGQMPELTALIAELKGDEETDRQPAAPAKKEQKQEQQSQAAVAGPEPVSPEEVPEEVPEDMPEQDMPDEKDKDMPEEKAVPGGKEEGGEATADEERADAPEPFEPFELDEEDYEDEEENKEQEKQ